MERDGNEGSLCHWCGHMAFGKFLKRSVKSLVAEAVLSALTDTGVEKGAQLNAAFFRNAMLSESKKHQ